MTFKNVEGPNFYNAPPEQIESAHTMFSIID